MAEHIRKLLHSTILYLPAQFLPPLVQFITTVVWTHLLDPATFGFVNFIISVQEIVAYAGLTGWTLFMLRFRERFREMERTAEKPLEELSAPELEQLWEAAKVKLGGAMKPEEG